MKKFLNRNDIAIMLECSVAQVRKNEARWGLKEARRDLNSRCIRYVAPLALKNLQARGLLVVSV